MYWSCATRDYFFFWKIENIRMLKNLKFIIWTFAILMSIWSLYLRNPSTDSIFYFHIERPYIGAVQKRVILFFSWKLKKWEYFKNVFFFILTCNIYEVVQQYLRNPSTDWIHLGHMEIIYIRAVQQGVIFVYFFSKNKKKEENSKIKRYFSYGFAIVCTAYISSNSPWIWFSFCTWKDHILEPCTSCIWKDNILELCNWMLFFFSKIKFFYYYFIFIFNHFPCDLSSKGPSINLYARREEGVVAWQNAYANIYSK